MEKPYRYRKGLVKVGNSNYIIIPLTWLQMQEKRLRKKNIIVVDVEIYSDKIVITPAN